MVAKKAATQVAARARRLRRSATQLHMQSMCRTCPGRKLKASLNAAVNESQPSLSRHEGLAQWRNGRSASVVAISGCASSASAAGASGKTTRKTEPPPGHVR
jgi:hypothetical protein